MAIQEYSSQATRTSGIGAAKATAIIEYRTKHGNFKTKEELLEVKGIGPKILEEIAKEIEI